MSDTAILCQLSTGLALLNAGDPILLPRNRVNNPGRSQKIVISPCAQFRAAAKSQHARRFDRIQEHKKLGLALRPPIIDSRLMTLLVVTSARMILFLMGTSGLGMIGAGLRATKVFWPASFVLWLHISVSMRFLAMYNPLPGASRAVGFLPHS